MHLGITDKYGKSKCFLCKKGWESETHEELLVHLRKIHSRCLISVNERKSGIKIVSGQDWKNDIR